jgi:hypothetical protein
MSDDWQVVEEALKSVPLQAWVGNQPVGPGFYGAHPLALAALARLREREAQLEQANEAHLAHAVMARDTESVWKSRAEAAEARVAELTRERERLAEYEEQWNELAGVEFIEYWHTIGYSCSAGTAIKALLARVAELEEALRKIASAPGRKDNFDEIAVARRALAHKEETP